MGLLEAYLAEVPIVKVLVAAVVRMNGPAAVLVQVALLPVLQGAEVADLPAAAVAVVVVVAEEAGVVKHSAFANLYYAVKSV